MIELVDENDSTRDNAEYSKARRTSDTTADSESERKQPPKKSSRKVDLSGTFDDEDLNDRAD